MQSWAYIVVISARSRASLSLRPAIPLQLSADTYNPIDCARHNWGPSFCTICGIYREQPHPPSSSITRAGRHIWTPAHHVFRSHDPRGCFYQNQHFPLSYTQEPPPSRPIYIHQASPSIIMLSPDGFGAKNAAPSIWSFDSGYSSQTLDEDTCGNRAVCYLPWPTQQHLPSLTYQLHIVLSTKQYFNQQSRRPVRWKCSTRW